MISQEDAPRVVFDCMVYLQATANENGPAAAALRLFECGRIVLCISPEILKEIGEVLNRPKVRQKNPRITNASVEALLRRLADKAVLMDNVPKVFEYPRDPKDEPYINVAIAVGAQCIVSQDKDLLDLMKRETPQGRVFRTRFEKMRIVDPLTFLNEMG